MIETSLYTWLVANIALIGTRVYPRKLPQDATFPALTYFEVSGDRWVTHQGEDGVSEGRYQISCWAKDGTTGVDGYAIAKGIADEVITKLNCFTGLMDTTTIQACRYLNEVDLGDEEMNLHQIALDFYITYEE